MTYYKQLAPILVFAYCLLYLFFGEQIWHVSNSFYFDGDIYGPLAQNFYHQLVTKGLDNYHFARILPSFIVYSIAHIVHYTLISPTKVMCAFSVYNSVLLTGIAWLWLKICRNKNFSNSIFWLGFICLFVNFAVLKAYQFDTVLTDITAYSFGMLILYFYVINRPGLICLITFFAAFTWPIVSYMAFFLVLAKTPGNNQKLLLPQDKWLPYGAVVFLLLVGLALSYRYPFQLPVAKSLFIVSFFISSLYTFIVFKSGRLVGTIISSHKIMIETKKSHPYYYVFVVVITSLILLLLRHRFGHHIYFGNRIFIENVLVTSVQKPGIFLLAHIAFLGPVVILLALVWKKLFSTALAESVGLYLFLFATLLLSLDSESRQLIFNFPVIVYILCLCLAKINVNWKFNIIFFIISLLLSKVYVLIGLTPSVGEVADYRWQRFLMNFGPWMNWTSYFINLALTLFSVIVIYFAFNFAKQASHIKNASSEMLIAS